MEIKRDPISLTFCNKGMDICKAFKTKPASVCVHKCYHYIYYYYVTVTILNDYKSIFQGACN